MFGAFFAPVAAALVIGTLILALTKRKVLPRSFGDLLPHFVVGVIAGLLGFVAPTARIEHVGVLYRLIPLVGFAVLAVAAFTVQD